jgi:hypothetical protein
VVGGGVIFKGNPSFIINQTRAINNFSFAGYIYDTRNKLDKLFAVKLFFAQFFFPYILYVFKKSV